MDLHRMEEPRTLSDYALGKLREAIISRDLAPGSALPLRELIDRLQMSSVPIREALRYLERSGLVDRRPHRGTVVAEMSVQDLQETYAIRLSLESMAVGMAAQRMTEEQAVALEELVDRYASALERQEPEGRQLHRELHMTLYAMSDSKWLLRLIPMLWDNSERYQRLSLPARGGSAKIIEEHRAIVDACIRRDPEQAELALRKHLAFTTEAAIAALEEIENPEPSAL